MTLVASLEESDELLSGMCVFVSVLMASASESVSSWATLRMISVCLSVEDLGR